MTKPPNYRIIFNWDNSPHSTSEVPQSMETFLEKVYSPLDDTQVDAHFWCLGDQHLAHWKSDIFEAAGDVHGRKYENVSRYIHMENIRQMLERGEDPQVAVINRAHEIGIHAYASIRMNDNHFNGAQIEDMDKLHDSALTKMRIDHPEWLLGDKTTEWMAMSWNYEIPEVREYMHTYIKEVCSLYDWDGIELDWQRHSFHLPQDYGYRMRYVLTDLQRAVRDITNKISEERGRPFYLAARVAPSLEMCQRIGYDVPVWVAEGLIDILIPAGGYGTDPSIDVSSYVDLCQGTEISVYPGLDVWLVSISEGEHTGTEKFVGPEDPETKDKMRNRATASKYYSAGANGIYTFNWYANKDSKRELLTQLGSPETLRRTDKIYASTHRSLRKEGSWRGALRNDRILGEVPVPLKYTITADGPVIILNVVDDLTVDVPKYIELRVHLDQWVKGDIVRLFWNEEERINVEINYRHDQDTVGNPFKALISDVGTSVWLRSGMNVSEVLRGSNSVKVVLEKRNPRLANDIVLTNVELLLKFEND